MSTWAEIDEQVGNRSDRVTFDQWIGGRDIACYSTNSGAQPIAFQSWRNFKEAFAPELIGQAFEETSNALGRQVESCIDPFGGSGTTALACQFLGVKPLTIEVNPYLADLIEAKIASYNIDSVIADYDRVLSRRGRKNSGRPFANAPKTFVEPGVRDRFLFNLPVANRLADISRRIERLNDRTNSRLEVGCRLNRPVSGWRRRGYHHLVRADLEIGRCRGLCPRLRPG